MDLKMTAGDGLQIPGAALRRAERLASGYLDAELVMRERYWCDEACSGQP